MSRVSHINQFVNVNCGILANFIYADRGTMKRGVVSHKETNYKVGLKLCHIHPRNAHRLFQVLKAQMLH